MRIKVKANWLLIQSHWNLSQAVDFSPRIAWMRKSTRRKMLRESWARLYCRTSLRRSARNAQSLQATCWVNNCAKNRSWLVSEFSKSFDQESRKVHWQSSQSGKYWNKAKYWNKIEIQITKFRLWKKCKIPQQIALHWIKQTTNRELNQRSILKRWENAFFYWFSSDLSL